MPEVLEPEVKFDPFNLDTPVTQETIAKVETKAEEKPPVDEKTETKSDDKVEEKSMAVDADGIKFLKEKLNYDDWDTAKNEIESLKAKAQTPAEIKYANEQSKKLALAFQAGKIDEVYEILDKEIKLSKLTSAEVNEDTAPAIIKAQMKEKYKGLTDSQIEYKFNKQFGIPKKPEQLATETAEEYEEVLKDWEEKKADVKMEMLIEANLAKPELEKLKSELKYPEVAELAQTEKEPTPEELAEAKKNMEAFIQKADEAVKNFDGFNVEYKDKDVQINSQYKLSDEEKTSVSGAMKLLAENNYNSNAIFAERWVNDDMTFNFSQMAKDLAILESHEKSAEKFISDAAAKSKVQFIKEKHNIDLGKESGGDLQLENKEAQKKNEDAIWGL